MTRRLLDLFCGGGGAAMGYHRAGFEVVGVDINRQPNYPFEFHQGNALSDHWFYVLGDFDAVHASPPCRLWAGAGGDWGRRRTSWDEKYDVLTPTRSLLQGSGLPYVIENVPQAPIRHDALLCGTMFGLNIRKHRAFESNVTLDLPPAHGSHDGLYNPWAGPGRSAEKMRDAMGIDWLPISGGASRKAGYTGDLFNAIPPAYTEWIGRQL